ncbi:MAG: phage tail protein, partial [Dehalococcoidia bacterium]
MRPGSIPGRPIITTLSNIAKLLQPEDYPIPAFHFSVGFGQQSGAPDTSFQEVTGIGSEIQTEDFVEGGENRYVHRLPTAVRHPQLELKRGIAKIDSPLVEWCSSILEKGFSAPIVPKLIHVFLLDEKQDPIRAWSFDNAYPVNWEVENFGSTKNEVAIEKIVLSYNSSIREK